MRASMFPVPVQSLSATEPPEHRARQGLDQLTSGRSSVAAKVTPTASVLSYRGPSGIRCRPSVSCDPHQGVHHGDPHGDVYQNDLRVVRNMDRHHLNTTCCRGCLLRTGVSITPPVASAHNSPNLMPLAQPLKNIQPVDTAFRGPTFPPAQSAPSDKRSQSARRCCSEIPIGTYI